MYGLNNLAFYVFYVVNDADFNGNDERFCKNDYAVAGADLLKACCCCCRRVAVTGGRWRRGSWTVSWGRMSTTAGCDPGSVYTVFVAVVFWPQEHGLEEPVLRSWDFTEFLTTASTSTLERSVNHQSANCGSSCLIAVILRELVFPTWYSCCSNCSKYKK